MACQGIFPKWILTLSKHIKNFSHGHLKMDDFYAHMGGILGTWLQYIELDIPL